MAHTIVGTAGHIDHGKTLLVKALTGMDTDRAPEERERGITIELGFAFLGEEITLIDVPGHERFVKTMVAGVSTIDVALFVIAADDGVMPQSREHLDVLQLLGVRRGVVALNKADLVDDEWLDLVEEEVRELVRGTFLEGAEILRVSALEGRGIEALRAKLQALAADTAEKRVEGPFRLPVDRAFLVKGFGLVCTGTALSGQLRAGEALAALPGGLESRVRSLQKHGREVDLVRAGERAAINLPGLERAQVERGHWLVAPGYLRPTHMLDVRLRLLSSSPKPLEQRSRVRLHLGTGEIMARVVLIDCPHLEPGQEAYAQLRLEEPAVAVWGDRFVIRRYSPPLTIGGGRVLDPHPLRHRRGTGQALELLRGLDGEEIERAVEARLRQARDRLVGLRELAGDLGIGVERIGVLLGALEEAGQAQRFEAGAAHAEVVAAWAGRIEASLADFHRQQPLRAGLKREELRNLAARGLQSEFFEGLLAHLGAVGRIEAAGAMVSAAGHRIRFSAEQEPLRASIEQRVRGGDLAAIPGAGDLAEVLGAAPADVDAVLGALQSLGEVVLLEGGLLVHASTLAALRERLQTYLQERGEITVATFRELIGSNRKYALALLGHFDGEGFTERRGDVRVLKK